MFVEYEVLDKKTKKNASELFFKIMEEHYEGSKGWGHCWKDIDVMSYKFLNNIEVLVSDKPLYNNRPTSVIIFGGNDRKISKIKSELEKQTEDFKLKFIEKNKE